MASGDGREAGADEGPAGAADGAGGRLEGRTLRAATARAFALAWLSPGLGGAGEAGTKSSASASEGSRLDGASVAAMSRRARFLICASSQLSLALMGRGHDSEKVPARYGRSASDFE